jgi:GT2 family glycosyltransferase/SAM-dependent methyltransferase
MAEPIGRKEAAIFENEGYCYCCDSKVKFSATNNWFRDFYLCKNCGSCPRERALMYSIDRFFPNWRELAIHESSPLDRGASRRIRKEASHYLASQYYPGVPSGQVQDGFRCENLEAMSFADNSFDLHITQDVFEHIFNPVAAFQELARTLKPGGAHIFTVPLVNKNSPTRQCAALDGKGKVIHLVEKPEYHGNPVDTAGSLVTWHWGYDIRECIYQACGLFTEMIWMDALDLGMRAEFIEVLIMRKPPVRQEPSAFYPLLQKNIDPLLSGQAVPSTETILKAVESACQSDNPRVAFASMLTMADILIGNNRAPFARMVLDGALRLAGQWKDPYALQQIRVLEQKMKSNRPPDAAAKPIVTITEASPQAAPNRAAETWRLLSESGDLSAALDQYKNRLDNDLLDLVRRQAASARAGKLDTLAEGLEALCGKIQEAMQASSEHPTTPAGQVDIVIPIYGQAPLVRRCVQSVLRTVPSGKIILVDDCSPGEEVSGLFAEWKSNPRLMMMTTPSNLGFLGASKLGASRSQAPFILFLNSDTEALESGWLEAMIPSDEKIAVVGAKLLYPPDAPAPLAGTIQHAGIARNRNGVPYHPFLGWAPDAAEDGRPRDVNAVTGACFLVRRSVWQELGGWDADFGRGVYEDVDFCWRARKQGYRILYAPAALLHHRESASVAPDGRHTLNQHTEANRRKLLERWRLQNGDEAIFFGEKTVQRWEKARALMQSAQPALAKGDFKAGLPGLRKAADTAPDWSEALLAYAGALSAAGDHARAVEYFQKALRLAPAVWDARLKLADELILADQKDNARAELLLLQNVFPEHPLVRQRLAAFAGPEAAEFAALLSEAAAGRAAATLEMLLAQEDLPAALKEHEGKLDEALLRLVRQSAQEARAKQLADLAEGLDSLAAHIAQVVAGRPVGPVQWAADIPGNGRFSAPEMVTGETSAAVVSRPPDQSTGTPPENPSAVMEPAPERTAIRKGNPPAQAAVPGKRKRR